MKTLFFLSLIAISAALSSCGKKGCTDADAANYCESCKKTDGSCTYESDVVFWYDKATSDSLYDFGSSSLTFYLDGAIIGSSAITVYNLSVPSCGGGAANASKELGTSKSKTYSYSVKDDLGDEIWAATVTMQGNTCHPVQLVW